MPRASRPSPAPPTVKPDAAAKIQEIAAPAPYEYEVYIGDPQNADIAGFDAAAASLHYQRTGRAEGRVAGRVRGRASFHTLIPPGARILEIGPFCSPAFARPAREVEFLDALTTEELRAKAARTPGANPDAVPHIDHVWRGEPYAQLMGAKTFDYAYSSHAIEHQPCLVFHLNEIASILREGGQYFVIVPDKRYCFDAFFPETNIADVLDAYIEGRRMHSTRSLMRGWLLTTHNDPKRHWAGDRPVDTLRQPITEAYAARVAQSVERRRKSVGYIDAHAWQFTPDNFEHLIKLLYRSGLAPLDCEAVYPTLRNTFEFYAILRKR